MPSSIYKRKKTTWNKRVAQPKKRQHGPKGQLGPRKGQLGSKGQPKPPQGKKKTSTIISHNVLPMLPSLPCSSTNTHLHCLLQLLSPMLPSHPCSSSEHTSPSFLPPLPPLASLRILLCNYGGFCDHGNYQIWFPIRRHVEVSFLIWVCDH